MKKHFMIDIETTGVEKEDSILQVALVEIEFKCGFWHLTGREFERTLHYKGEPQSEFAKKHMTALYKKCNQTDPFIGYELVKRELQEFIHPDVKPSNLNSNGVETPKFFMGWNASNFDMPFMFNKALLRPSYYRQVDGKEVLAGDAHYRIYEQTGSVQVLSDITGLDRKTLEVLALDLNPTGLKLPEGKEHDALYDCYKQIIMQNGLIKIGRMGILK